MLRLQVLQISHFRHAKPPQRREQLGEPYSLQPLVPAVASTPTEVIYRGQPALPHGEDRKHQLATHRGSPSCGPSSSSISLRPTATGSCACRGCGDNVCCCCCSSLGNFASSNDCLLSPRTALDDGIPVVRCAHGRSTQAVPFRQWEASRAGRQHTASRPARQNAPAAGAMQLGLWLRQPLQRRQHGHWNRQHQAKTCSRNAGQPLQQRLRFFSCCEQVLALYLACTTQRVGSQYPQAAVLATEAAYLALVTACEPPSWCAWSPTERSAWMAPTQVAQPENGVVMCGGAW